LLFKWRMFSFRKYKFHVLISKFKIKWYQIKLSCTQLNLHLSRCCGFLRQFESGRVLNLNKKIFALIHIKESTKISGFFFKVTCSGRKHFISKRNYAWELRFWINLIDRVTQHDFVDTNFGQSCSKIEIWFMFNCQTKRAIFALFIYPEIPPCRFFFWARWSNIFCLFTWLRNPAQFPHNHCFLSHNLLPKTCTIFFFFPHPVRRPVYAMKGYSYKYLVLWMYTMPMFLVIPPIQGTKMQLTSFTSSLTCEYHSPNYTSHSTCFVADVCFSPTSCT